MHLKMEQLTPITYRFSAFARSVEGTAQPFLLEISEPKEDGDGVCTCSVSCPFLRAKPYRIHGAGRATGGGPYKESLVADGIPSTSFMVDDLDAEYARLSGVGVAFTQTPMDAGPVRMAVLDALCGKPGSTGPDDRQAVLGRIATSVFRAARLVETVSPCPGPAAARRPWA